MTLTSTPNPGHLNSTSSRVSLFRTFPLSNLNITLAPTLTLSQTLPQTLHQTLTRTLTQQIVLTLTLTLTLAPILGKRGLTPLERLAEKLETVSAEAKSTVLLSTHKRKPN